MWVERNLEFRQPTDDDFGVLADLRKRRADDDELDPLSTMESLSSSDDLRDLASRSEYFCVAEVSDEVAGYGFIRWWDETAGLRLVLCDWYVDLTLKSFNASLLRHLEQKVLELDLDNGNALVGTNASSVQPARAEAIAAAGYEHIFTQVEMELRLPGKVVKAAHPEGIDVRNVRPDDARALYDLTQRVWAGREYFSMPEEGRFEGWVQRSDLSLFNCATVDGSIVGFVASSIRSGMAQIEDVQVDPDYRRKGIATALLLHNLHVLGRRRVDVVRLNTESHDPAGALSLYCSLGFQVVRSYMRYRKPWPRCLN